MNDTKYNGWTNYETWLVKLWMDNEQGSVNFWREQANNALEETTHPDYDNGIFTPQENATFILRENLKEYHEDAMFPEEIPSHGVFHDLLIGALGAVNWQEIAKHIIDDEMSEREYQKNKIESK